MGDRVLVIFTDGAEVSPTVYLHWNGTATPALLARLKDLMKGREGDVQYSAARFIGICHKHIEGNLSLGTWNTEPATIEAIRKKSADLASVLENESHGDAGVVLFNVNDMTWKAYGGYLAKEEAA